MSKQQQQKKNEKEGMTRMQAVWELHDLIVKRLIEILQTANPLEVKPSVLRVVVDLLNLNGITVKNGGPMGKERALAYLQELDTGDLPFA